MIKHPWLKTIILMAAMALTGVARGQSPDSDNVPARDINELKADARHHLDAQWQNIPSLGEKPPQDVINFSIEQGRLIAHSNLPQSASGRRVSMRGFPGEAVVRNIQSINIPQDTFLMIEYHDFSRADSIDIQDQIISAPTMMQLVRDIEYPEHTQTVTLMQSFVSQGNDAVTLRVQDTTNPEDKPITSFVMTASTLANLRLEHPAEVEQYLRPLFRDFGQGAVFMVDAKLAWQVAADGWKAPPGLAGRVMDVVAGFNSENYPQREAAQTKLSGMGEPAALYLMSIDRGKFTPEQKVRTDNFLHFYRPAGAEQVVALRSNVSFLLDCLDSDDAELRALVLEHLQKAVGHEVKFDVNLGSAERVEAIGKLREELIPIPTTEPTTRP